MWVTPPAPSRIRVRSSSICIAEPVPGPSVGPAMIRRAIGTCNERLRTRSAVLLKPWGAASPSRRVGGRCRLRVRLSHKGRPLEELTIARCASLGRGPVRPSRCDRPPCRTASTSAEIEPLLSATTKDHSAGFVRQPRVKAVSGGERVSALAVDEEQASCVRPRWRLFAAVNSPRLRFPVVVSLGGAHLLGSRLFSVHVSHPSEALAVELVEADAVRRG
jgi:hypothetical protein